LYWGSVRMTTKFDASAAVARMDELAKKSAVRHLSKDELAEFSDLDHKLERTRNGWPGYETDAEMVETRGGGGSDRLSPGEIEGRPGEELKRGQSMTEWVRRAAENGVTAIDHDGARPERIRYHDKEYLNQYFGQLIGNQVGQRWNNGKVESRAILEDTVNSGQAITPQSWTGQFYDVLYPMTVLGRVGVNRVPMPTELVNVPVFASPSEPAWLPEASAIGVDSSPAFSTVQLSATGGTKWTTLISLEMAHDAYINGGLPELLSASAARQVAVQVDTYGFMGTALTNAGLPGIINELGVGGLGAFNNRYYTGASSGSPETPTDTTELSKIRELLANKNVDTSGSDVYFVSNPSVKSTILRTNASTYARYWEFPPDVVEDGLDRRWVESANPIFPTTETAPAATGDAPAQTGGDASSLYAGPWSYVMLGQHVDLQTRVLSERYVDQGYVGLFAFCRYSVRCARPDLFYRTTSIATS
jgi:Phage capsid family